MCVVVYYVTQYYSCSYYVECICFIILDLMVINCTPSRTLLMLLISCCASNMASSQIYNVTADVRSMLMSMMTRALTCTILPNHIPDHLHRGAPLPAALKHVGPPSHVAHKHTGQCRRLPASPFDKVAA